MVTHVQTQTTIGASGTSAAVTISTTAGNTLVVVADCYSSTNAAFHVTGISDSHNTWTFSTANSNANPPVGQSWDGSFQGLILIGAVTAAAAVTSVTVNFSASLTYIDLAVYEFSGVPAGSGVAVANASSTLVTAASVTTPSVTVPSGASLAVAAQTNDGNAGSNTSVSSGWTLDSAGDHFAAWQLSPAAGSLSATFTSTSSQHWLSSAILVIGPSNVSVSLPAAQAAAAAPAAGSAAGPVALPAAQAAGAAYPPAASVSTPLPAAQVTDAALPLSPVFAGGAALPVAQVTGAAPPATGSASAVIALPAAQASAAAYPPVTGAAVPLAAAQATAAGHLLSPPPSTVAVAGSWSGSFAVASGFVFPFPAARPVQVTVANTAGDWLFALVSWRPAAAGSGVSVSVADDAHNWWEPVGAPSADSGAAGAVRTAVWAAPAARVASTGTGKTIVQVAPSGPVLSVAALIVDMSGLLPWYQVAAVSTAQANAATSLSVPGVTPPGRSLLFAAFGSDNNSDTVTGPSGWTALTAVTASNGVDSTADVRLTPAWQVTSSPAPASVTSSGTLDLAGAVAGVLVSAPAPPQPSPDWPVMITEAAPGAGVQTPPSQTAWTDISARTLSMSMTQGRQYSLSQLSAGQGTLTLDDPDGAALPPGTGIFAGIDSGTPLRRRVIVPASPTPHYVAMSGYFRRWPWNMDAALLRGRSQTEIADVWAYATAQLNSMAVEECLLDSPYALWPMTDPAGASGASNLAPGGGLPLAQVQSKFGAGGATAAWGANSGALRGAGSARVTASGASGGASGMWQQTLAGVSLGQNEYGFALQAVDPGYPPIANGVTVECAAQFKGTFTAAQQVTFTATASNSQFACSSSVATGSAVVLAAETGFTFPSGVTAGTTYYVIGNTGTNIQLSATPGGSAVTVTADGQGYIQVIIPWDPVVFSARDGQGGVFGLSIRGSDGALLLLHRSGTGLASTVADAARDYRAAGLVHYSLAVTQTAWRLLADGGGILTASGTFSPALPASFRELCYGGTQDATQQGYAFSGYFGFGAVYPVFSQQVRVLSRYLATVSGLSGDAADSRIERILEYAGLAGRRWIGQQAVTYEGDLTVSGQDIGGQAAAGSAGNIAQSTLPAMLYVAPTGDVVYRSKLYSWNEPVRWVLGTDAAAGEIPFTPGSFATDYDPSRVVEDVQLTQLDTQAVTLPAGTTAGTTMTAVAAATARQYGGQSYQQTGYLEFDWSSPYTAGGGLNDLANWLANVYSRPASRVQAVTVNAVANSANGQPASPSRAWEFFAGASPGDMVQVNVRVPTASTTPLISLVARISQVQRQSAYSTGGTSATVSAVLDFAPEYNALTCDDPVHGLLDGSQVLPW